MANLRYLAALVLAGSISTLVPSLASPGPKGLLAELAGRELKYRDANWLKATAFVTKNYPGAGQILATTALCRVWNIGPRYVVLETGQIATRTKANAIVLYWFDRASKPLGQDIIPFQGQFECTSALLVPMPGTSTAVVATSIRSVATGDSVRAYFGLDDRAPVLCRLTDAKGKLIANRFDRRLESLSPRIVAYTKASILQALKGGNPVLQLEALTWLGGKHTQLTGKFLSVPDEQNSEIYRAMTLTKDHDVKSTVQALTQSKVHWVSVAAAFALPQL